MGYYDDLFNESDPARSAGWRHPIEQALRFEFALRGMQSWTPSTSLLDVGCGPGSLFRYLSDTDRVLDYIGLDCYAPSVELARKLSPDGTFLVGDVVQASRRTTRFDAVVAIGAIVDGDPYASTIERHKRLLSMVRAACDRASRYVCLVVLKHEYIMKTPLLEAETALMGATRDELDALMRHLSNSRQLDWVIEDDVTAADRALYITLGDEVLCQDWEPMAIKQDVIAGPWGVGLPDWRVAWYWWVVGQPELALDVLDGTEEEPCAESKQLRRRLALLLS